MLLAVDIGNTQTVIGLFSAEELENDWRIATEDTMTSDEICVKLKQLFSLSGRNLSEIGSIIIGSVVPSLTDTWVDVARDVGIENPLVVDHTTDTGLVIAFDNPAEAGADRLATNVAAIDKYGAPIIVVDFGTATTLDVINGDNEYLGGTISTGVETSAEALFAHAARLSKVELELPPKVIGTDTTMSIQAGILVGEALKVDGLVRRIELELGERPTVVATGGLAYKVAGASETIRAVDSDLTLKGLSIIARRNGLS